ncbi:hypothetical protein PoB_003251900 [Plakobranchus ocellatus]|uniref:Uncharacterized protein n=1 Tax=Plakobranchus ocellatus TaxID=259542 RepID=A0AAV4AIE2_9GAST|nr:hypothetical protein PoB_003251900 [Plakobranchus ocellatus]
MAIIQRCLFLIVWTIFFTTFFAKTQAACSRKGTAYRDGSEVTFKGKCGNPHRCIARDCRPRTDQCRMTDGSCLAMYHYRDGYTCIKDVVGFPALLEDGAMLISPNMLTFPYICGKPRTCIRRNWVPAMDQCRWKETCLNLWEKRDGKICVQLRYGTTGMTSEKNCHTWRGKTECW